jgi:hypothetical protein
VFCDHKKLKIFSALSGYYIKKIKNPKKLKNRGRKNTKKVKKWPKIQKNKIYETFFMIHIQINPIFTLIFFFYY